MIEQLRRVYRLMLNRCPGCGAEPGEVVTVEQEWDTPLDFCLDCGSPHIIMAPLRCDRCGALMDQDERLFDDDEEME